MKLDKKYILIWWSDFDCHIEETNSLSLKKDRKILKVYGEPEIFKSLKSLKKEYLHLLLPPYSSFFMYKILALRKVIESYDKDFIDKNQTPNEYEKYLKRIFFIRESDCISFFGH